MAEFKPASNQSVGAKIQTEAASEDLSAQITALRDDLSKLSESVMAVGQGAKTAVTDEASMMAERLRNKVREEPLMAIGVAAGIAYLFGLMGRR